MKTKVNTSVINCNLSSSGLSEILFVNLNNVKHNEPCIALVLNRELVPSKRGSVGYKAFLRYTIPELVVSCSFNSETQLLTVQYIGDKEVTESEATEKYFYYDPPMLQNIVDRDKTKISQYKQVRRDLSFKLVREERDFNIKSAKEMLESIRSSIDLALVRISEGKTFYQLTPQQIANYNANVAKVDVLNSVIEYIDESEE